MIGRRIHTPIPRRERLMTKLFSLLFSSKIFVRFIERQFSLFSSSSKLRFYKQNKDYRTPLLVE
jgi:hypothetical protein